MSTPTTAFDPLQSIRIGASAGAAAGVALLWSFGSENQTAITCVTPVALVITPFALAFGFWRHFSVVSVVYALTLVTTSASVWLACTVARGSMNFGDVWWQMPGYCLLGLAVILIPVLALSLLGALSGRLVENLRARPNRTKEVAEVRSDAIRAAK